MVDELLQHGKETCADALSALATVACVQAMAHRGSALCLLPLHGGLAIGRGGVAHPQHLYSSSDASAPLTHKTAPFPWLL